MPIYRLALAAVAALSLAACGHHGMHPHTAAPATPPATTVASKPMLDSGYKKVPAPANASVYIINLKNGDTVANPVRVLFGLSGVGVAPAGMEKENTGHHHLLIDVAAIDLNAPVPFDDNHRHFGGGQTEVTLALKPGTHTLQLLLADHNHIPHHPAVLSERITITVR